MPSLRFLTPLLFLLIFVFPSVSYAQKGPYRDTFRAAVQANKQISLNPPLPMLYYSKGEYQISIKPSYITGELVGDEGEYTTVSSELTGGGGGLSFSYAFADRWGFYVWGTGATVSGDSEIQTGDDNPVNVKMNGLKGSFGTLSVGLVRQFFGDEDGGFVLPVFFGPLIAKSKMSQTVVAPGFQADFDMELDETAVGAMIGMQMSFNAGKYFKFNPFLIGGSFGFTECHEYKVTAIRDDRQNFSSEAFCGGKNRFLLFPSWIMTIGVNLIYRPWGLGINLTAPVLKNAFFSGDDVTEFATFSISQKFGNYKH